MTIRCGPVRFGASLLNAIERASGVNTGAPLCQSPWIPSMVTLTRTVVPSARSRTNTSSKPPTSFGTRFVASLPKAMKRPSADTATDHGDAGCGLARSPCAPDDETLTRSVVPACRSRRNTSATLLVSSGTSEVASLQKTTKRPSARACG